MAYGKMIEALVNCHCCQNAGGAIESQRRQNEIERKQRSRRKRRRARGSRVRDIPKGQFEPIGVPGRTSPHKGLSAKDLPEHRRLLDTSTPHVEGGSGEKEFWGEKRRHRRAKGSDSAINGVILLIDRRRTSDGEKPFSAPMHHRSSSSVFIAVNLLLSKWMRELEKEFYGNIVAFYRAMLLEAKQDDVQIKKQDKY
ncbi:hypothetical protein LXL04_007124 [Taraxacum kok-saghyz]